MILLLVEFIDNFLSKFGIKATLRLQLKFRGNRACRASLSSIRNPCACVDGCLEKRTFYVPFQTCCRCTQMHWSNRMFCSFTSVYKLAYIAIELAIPLYLHSGWRSFSREEGEIQGYQRQWFPCLRLARTASCLNQSRSCTFCFSSRNFILCLYNIDWTLFLFTNVFFLWSLLFLGLNHKKVKKSE